MPSNSNNQTPTSRPSSPTTALPAHAFISLGSNLGDRAANLLLGVRGMMDAGLRVVRLSSIYETEPVDVFDQPAFLNMVAKLERTDSFSSEQLLARLLRVEHALGRRRDVPRGPRTIDLDLLIDGNEQRNTEFLMLPHPRLHLRRFVLVPLAELTPHLVHPTLHQTINELLASTDDNSRVERWTGQNRLRREN
jgi:2-amino-4-hydroxy-6-hydroxymethyldihydropteridine diphosphokinase